MEAGPVGTFNYKNEKYNNKRTRLTKKSNGAIDVPPPVDTTQLEYISLVEGVKSFMNFFVLCEGLTA